MSGHQPLGLDNPNLGFQRPFLFARGLRLTVVRKKVLAIVGTRPEAIKMAPIILKAKHFEGQFDFILGTTGQHEELLLEAMEAFGLELKIGFNLRLMKNVTDLAGLTSGVLDGLNHWLDKENPDIVLVHGDTTTTFGVALACFYRGIPVGHVEAGLRTNDLTNPFPEEFNRQLVSKIATWHFCPTELARENLLKEGVPATSILVSGNTVIDALDTTIARLTTNSTERAEAESRLTSILGFHVLNSPIVVVTTHRRESLGAGMREIFHAVAELSRRFKSFHFVLPIHPNPQISDFAKGIFKDLTNVHVVKALGYQEFTLLLSKTLIVITDSGGLQEETARLGIPVLVARTVTERPEGVRAGISHLVGTSSEKIIEIFSQVAPTALYGQKNSANTRRIYGNGNASDKILKHISAEIKRLEKPKGRS